MRLTAKETGTPPEVAILARVLGNEDGILPAGMARYILRRGFSKRDKARLHDLANRNQSDTLSAAEQAELFAFVKAGTLLSILKAKARRVLQARARRRAAS